MDARLAVVVVRERRPDLVLFDLTLLGIEGFAVAVRPLLVGAGDLP